MIPEMYSHRLVVKKKLSNLFVSIVLLMLLLDFQYFKIFARYFIFLIVRTMNDEGHLFKEFVLLSMFLFVYFYLVVKSKKDTINLM